MIDVISPKNGKALSIETLVSYEKKERAGEFSDYSEGNSNKMSTREEFKPVSSINSTLKVV